MPEIVNNITELLNLPTLTPMRLALVAVALFLAFGPESWKAKVFGTVKAALAKLTGKAATIPGLSGDSTLEHLITAQNDLIHDNNPEQAEAVLQIIAKILPPVQPKAVPVETPNV